MDLKNKVVLVSGSSSGIGAGCVNLLLENNANVIGLDIEPNSINEEHYRHYTIDVRDEQNISLILDEIEKSYGVIDGLVNCAGIFANSKPSYELSLEEWNNVISINLTGSFLLAKHSATKSYITHKHPGGSISYSR